MCQNFLFRFETYLFFGMQYDWLKILLSLLLFLIYFEKNIKVVLSKILEPVVA